MKRLTYLGLRALSALQHFGSERLTLAGWLVLGAAGTAAALGIDTSRTMNFQAFTFGAALLLVAFVVAWFFRVRAGVARELPRYATAGERFDYRVVVHNQGKRAIEALSVRETLRDPRPGYAEWRRAREPGEERRNWFDREQGYFRWRWLIERRTPERATRAALESVPPGERRSVTLWLRPRRRGRLELDAVQLSRLEPLGLVRGLAKISAPGRVIALPKRYRLPAFALPGQRRFQQGGVTLATSVGDSEEFIGLREYRPGDPLQRVHWKSYARTGSPIVKEFQDEFFERHALILDTSTDRGEDAAFEEAVAVAASFVYAIDTRECLLDLLFVGGEVRTYTAGRGQMQLEHMLEVLAGVGPSAPADFAELARAVLAQRGALTSCVVVLLSWDDARRSFVDALRRTGVELRVLLVSETTQVPAGVTLLHPGSVGAGLAALR
ncbi:MAG TPA: DUF58 domain-containing protein [Burkholderiales bacterium]|nr:DUF58 domain-containing protein [Burkholderiales bacterium]